MAFLCILSINIQERHKMKIKLLLTSLITIVALSGCTSGMASAIGGLVGNIQIFIIFIQLGNILVTRL